MYERRDAVTQIHWYDINLLKDLIEGCWIMQHDIISFHMSLEISPDMILKDTNAHVTATLELNSTIELNITWTV